MYASTVGGGALVSFPLLVLTGIPIHFVIATQRLAGTILELASAVKFHKEKLINIPIAGIFGTIASIGALIGANLVVQINEKMLNIVIVLAFLFVFIILFNKKKIGVEEKKVTKKHFFISVIATFFLSIYGGFFGAGFGFFVTILLVLTGYTFIKSAAIGRVVGFVMSLTATIIFAQHGLINYYYGILMGGGFAIGSWIGIGIALKKGEQYVRTLFIVIMIFSLVKLLTGIFN